MVGAPGGKGSGGKNAEVGGHAEVAEPTKLSAEDRIGTRDGGGEVDVNILAMAGVGDGVLFQAKGGNGEAVNYVLGVQAQIDLAIGGEYELGGDEVVGPTRIGGVEAKWIALTGSNEPRTGLAKGGVRAGVTEVPGELHACGFDLECGEVGASVASGGPEALGAERKKKKQKSKCSKGKIFDQTLGARFSTGFPLKEKAKNADEMSRGEEGQGNPKIEIEVLVESGAVS